MQERTPKILYITPILTGNMDDRFIFEGSVQLLNDVVGQHEIYEIYYEAAGFQSVAQINIDRIREYKKIVFDVIVLTGTPWLWDMCTKSKKYHDLKEFLDVFKSKGPIIGLGLGSCYPLRFSQTVLNSIIKEKDDIKKIYSRFDYIATRDSLAAFVLRSIGIKADFEVCPSYYAFKKINPKKESMEIEDLLVFQDPAKSISGGVLSQEEVNQIIEWQTNQYRNHITKTICITFEDYETAIKIWPEEVELINDFERYVNLISIAKKVISPRIHACIPAFSLGKNVDMVPIDTRALTAVACGIKLNYLNLETELPLFATHLKPHDSYVRMIENIKLSITEKKEPDIAPSVSSHTEPLSITYEVITCPFCSEVKFRRFRSSADIVKCASCDTVYLRTRLKLKAMEELYQTYADEGSHMAIPRNDEEVQKSGLRRDYFMNELLEFIRPEGIILDVGCGWGAFLDNARSRGFIPRGIEITRKCVDFANTKLGITVTNHQFNDTPFDDESLAVVTMIHVLEHLPYPRKVLEYTFRILKPGGIFCGIVPNIDSFCSQNLVEQWYWLDPNYHYVHYSPTTLRKHLERAGFIIERMYTATGDYREEDVLKVICNKYNCSEDIARILLAEINNNEMGEEIRFFARKPLDIKRNKEQLG